MNVHTEAWYLKIMTHSIGYLSLFIGLRRRLITEIYPWTPLPAEDY